MSSKMERVQDPFLSALPTTADADFAALQSRSRTTEPTGPGAAFPTIGRFRGFDVLGNPLVGNLASARGAVLVARTTIVLSTTMQGKDVLVLFADGEVHAPVIVGIVDPVPPVATVTIADKPSTVTADGEVQLIAAEREIVLRCGDASITLTRAGKILIEGKYILSKSSGYNRIKGSAVDIN